MLTDENIELMIFRYKEGLLDAGERERVEKLLAKNAELREMADLYDPDLRVPAYSDTTFPDREKLKHHSVSRRWILFGTSAAACFVLLASFALHLILNNNNQDNVFIAQSDDEEIQEKNLIHSLNKTNDSSVIQNITPVRKKVANRVIHKESVPQKDLLTEADQNVDDVNTETNFDVHLVETDQLISYYDDYDETEPICPDNSLLSVCNGGQMTFAKPDTILTDKLISYFDDNENTNQKVSAHRTALGYVVEDWFNTIRLKGTELQLALINEINKTN